MSGNLINTRFDRRQFLTTSSVIAIAGFTSSLLPATRTFLPRREDPLFEISLAQWSLHRALNSGKIDNLDFPKVSKEEFGIEGVEYVNQFFSDKAEDEKYLGSLKKRCEDVGVESVLIMIDGEGAIGDADECKQKKAVENHHKWIEAAKYLGCHSIRVNAQSEGTYQEQVERVVEGLGSLAEFAQGYDINVIVENHGGLSSNGQWLAQVIRKVNLDNCGTLPDFGNFRIREGKNPDEEIWYDRYIGMSALMPFAKAVSAKSHDFDKAGNETKTDFMKMMRIVIDSGYRGWIGVEYEGGQLDEYEGIRATKRLLEKCRQQLTVG